MVEEMGKAWYKYIAVLSDSVECGNVRISGF
jgi:hypothetical protein